MNKPLLLLLVFFTFFTGNLYSQIYSFEDGVVPASWTATNGSLETTTEKYKLGAKTLAWNWNAGSLITATNLNNLSTASTEPYGGFHFWVYNANPITSNIKFSFLNSSNVVKFQIDFKLNFKGWRCFLCRFKEDYGHDRTELTKMTIQAPATGSGKLYFDYIEFRTSVDGYRNSDAQYRYNRDAAWEDLATRQSVWNFGSMSSVTPAQVAGVDTIAKRLDDWFNGTSRFSTAPEYISRKAAIQSAVNWSLKPGNPDLNLTVGSDGVVYGPSLFSTRLAASQPLAGVTLNTFAGPNQNTVYQQALDFSLTKSAASKTRWLNTLDWMYDQGWADGSGLGALSYEGLRWAGYPFSVYLMRKELSSDRLNQVLSILHNYGSEGLFTTYPYVGCNADIIRTMSVSKLAFTIMQEDPKRRVEAMTTLQRFFENSFLVHHGFGESFKPDYSGYHHASVYLSSYYPGALYTACFVYYLLYDTPYALPESVYVTLKNSLLAMRSVCATYSCPTATNGRFPNPSNTLVMNHILPAFACLALSKSQPDAELIAAFKRLWKPTQSPMKDMIASAGIAEVPRTLGAVQICLQAAALNIPAESNPKMSFFMPYAGLMVNRNNTRLVSVKGFSKFVQDFEADQNVRDGLLNRYQSYGQIEFTNIQTGRRNNGYELVEKYDWSRLPGTTSKYLLPDVLKVGSGGNYGDESFLGGASLNDSVSMFSMKLHDNKHDVSFRANKSVFCFGNALVCLGSNIVNSDAQNKTETTLLQHSVQAGENMSVNGVAWSGNQIGLQKPIIRDNLGNRFVVKSGAVDLYKNGDLYAAVINHGTAPSNQGYCYYMLLQGNDAQETKYSNPETCPVSVLRQDNVAHIVKHAETNSTCYAIFNSTANLNDALVASVNIPSVVMTKVMANGNCDLVVSDPDMHRGSAANLGALSYHGPVYEEPSAPFDYEIVLNDLFDLEGDNPGVVLTKIGNTTKIALTAIDGKAYKIGLKKLSTGLETLRTGTSFRLTGTENKNVFQIQSTDTGKFSVTLISVDGRVVRHIANRISSCLLDANGLSGGVYVVSMKNDKKMENVKIYIK